MFNIEILLGLFVQFIVLMLMVWIEERLLKPAHS